MATDLREPASRERTVSAPVRSTGRRSSQNSLWVYAALACGLVVMAGPFVWMLLGSLKPEGEIRADPPTWLPQDPTFANYRELFTGLPFATYFFNSVLVAAAVTFGTLAMSAMFGYALAKLDFPGRRALFALVIGTLMVPGMVTFVPQFMLVSNLGLIDTYPGLILPGLFGAFAGPFGVFLMRQFIMGLPDELIHAARVDGAGEFRIFGQIILPLCGPALATLGILSFLGSWNNFLWPLVAATSEERYTLPVALALYAVGENATDYGLLLAGAVVTVLPILAVFVLLQRHFVQGTAMTGFK